jgi:hypothetical protein
MVSPMAVPEPLMRAIQTQLLLRSVERLPAADLAAITARCGRPALERIDAVLAVSWHPMSLHMLLSDATRDVIGPERAIQVWRETMGASFQRPLLRGFVEMSTNLFGVRPSSLLRQSDRVYGQITRDLGALQFELDPSDTRGHLTLRGFPAARYRFICYVEGLMGCVESIFPLLGARGALTVESRDDARGDVRYRVTWTSGHPTPT